MGRTFVFRSVLALFTFSAFSEAQRGATGAQADGPAPLLNLQPAIAQGPIADLSQAGTNSAGAIVSASAFSASPFYLALLCPTLDSCR